MLHDVPGLFAHKPARFSLKILHADQVYAHGCDILLLFAQYWLLSDQDFLHAGRDAFLMNSVQIVFTFPFFQARFWPETEDPSLRFWLPWLDFPLLVQQNWATGEFALQLYGVWFPIGIAEPPHSGQILALTQEHPEQLIWLMSL